MVQKLSQLTPSRLAAARWFHGPAGVYLGPRDWLRLARSLGWTMRRLQVVVGIVNDKTELGIAVELGISRHTVHEYIQRTYRALGVHSRPALITHVVTLHKQLTDTRAGSR